MSGGEGLGKEVIETLAKVWNSVPCDRSLWRRISGDVSVLVPLHVCDCITGMTFGDQWLR